MKIFRYTPVAFLLLLGYSQSVLSQELLTPVMDNPVLLGKQLQPAINAQTKKAASVNAPLTLPLYDDFTQSSVYPDQTIWADKNVFINSDFAYRSFNRGVATFDALDSTGKIYSQATFAPFMADKLTSRSIRLDSLFSPTKRALKISDSLYLSFYYQPQGLGNDPQPADSLVLQFLDTVPVPWWRTVWSTPGMKLDTFYAHYGTYCRRVNVPIVDSAAFFRSDFKFRFVAYASLSGDMLPSWQSSMDHWNLDGVKLQTDGRYNDSTERWIGFAEKAPSMLRNFYAVPYTQYSDDPTAYITDTLSMFITNRHASILPARYGYQVLQGDGTAVSSYDGGNYYIEPFLNSGYFSNRLWAKPPVRTILPIDPYGLQDSAFFYVRHILKGDDPGLGDTIIFEQRMTNFFAYDDGVPELGYGLTPAGARMAVRYMLSKSDTLRAVRLYFNRVVNNANQQYYYLVVWSDDNGTPGRVLYQHELIRPTYSDSLYRYTQVLLNQPVPVLNSFFVGILQTTDDNLNIGFDRSRDNRNNNYFNVDGTWQKSQFPGTIMIRPVLGKALMPATPVAGKPKSGLELWPSVYRHSGDVNLVLDGEPVGESRVEMYDLFGRLVCSQQSFGKFNPRNCQNGVYVVRVTIAETNSTFTQKLLIAQ